MSEIETTLTLLDMLKISVPMVATGVFVIINNRKLAQEKKRDDQNLALALEKLRIDTLLADKELKTAP